MRLVAFLSFLVWSITYGASLPTASPEQSGLSKERLERLNTSMRRQMDAGAFAGASGLIARNGRVVFRETWGEMKPDSIVRLFSMTKAVTGVAAMMLYEEGRFSLTDPISKYMPEFSKMMVSVESKDADGKRVFKLVPAERPISVLDLFRHTSGFDYQGPKDESGVPAYRKAGVEGGFPVGLVPNLEEFAKKLATAPLNDHPGTMFRYGYSTDVLGRLVEVVSGKSLDQFFEERIFKPLGMVDTAFYVPEEKWGRFATLYSPKQGGGIQKSTGPAQDGYKKKPTLFMGGAGLVGTLDDYARFCLMLVNGGQLDGTRLLSRKSVELMGSDHLGSLPRAGVLANGYGFGLTFAVNPGPGKTPTVGSEGEFYWGGAAGTSFFIDPKEKMIGVFFVQVLPPTTVADQLKRFAYLALE